jgi:hypothetical protein
VLDSVAFYRAVRGCSPTRASTINLFGDHRASCAT